MSSERSKRIRIPNRDYNPDEFKTVMAEISKMKEKAQPIGFPFYKPIVLENFSSSSIQSLSKKRKRNMVSTIKDEEVSQKIDEADQADEADEADEAETEEDEEVEEQLVRPKRQKVNQKPKNDKFFDFINLFETSEFNQLLIDVGFPKTKEINQKTLHEFLTPDD